MAEKKKKTEPAKSELTHAVPTDCLVPGPLQLGWKIVSSILLNIEKDDDGEFVVTDSFSTVYGNAKSEKQAIMDYRLSLIDYYEILETQPQTPAVAAAFQRIRSYVDRTK